MKKTWLLFLLFLVLGGATWFVFQKKTAETGSIQNPDMAFAVKSTAEIQKVFIADRTGRTATIERQPDGTWLYNGKSKARKTAVETLMETLTHLNVQYVPPKAGVKTMVESLATDAVTVEVWNPAGERIRRYYIGGVTGDERGTFAIMEGSEQPYVVHIPGFIGQLRVRFLLGDDEWRDRTVFAEKPEEIQSVSVDYPGQKFQSFKIEKTGAAKFSIRPLYSEVPANPNESRKGIAEAYLVQFEKMGAEGFETTNPDRDSVSHTTPFAVVKLKKTDGSEKTVRFFEQETETSATGEKHLLRMFADASWGDFYLVQNRVFQGIFRTYSYFFGGKDEPVLKN